MEGTICVLEPLDMNSNTVLSVMIPVVVQCASDDEVKVSAKNKLVVVQGSLEEVLEPAEKKLSSEMSNGGCVLVLPLGAHHHQAWDHCRLSQANHHPRLHHQRGIDQIQDLVSCSSHD